MSSNISFDFHNSRECWVNVSSPFSKEKKFGFREVVVLSQVTQLKSWGIGPRILRIWPLDGCTFFYVLANRFWKLILGLSICNSIGHRISHFPRGKQREMLLRCVWIRQNRAFHRMILSCLNYIALFLQTHYLQLI